MIYDFLTVRAVQPSELAAALAEVAHVAPAEVDVADADGDDRDWSASVLCGYSAVTGDVASALEIHIQDWVARRPSERDLAVRLAARVGTPVLYSAEEGIPGAYWLAVPGGVVTRARLEQSDDEEPSYTVDAVEAPVPQLPRARVMQLPEILHEQEVPTPTTEAFVAEAASLGETRGGREDPELSGRAGSALDRARTTLLLWERLVRRMEGGWEPSGRYPAQMYAEDLRLRDRLERQQAEVPEVLRPALRRAVGHLDHVFTEHTVRDGGRALASALGDFAEADAGRGWWWLRSPGRVPWDAR